MSAVKSQSSLTEQSGMQAVDLTKLNLMQLTQFKHLLLDKVVMLPATYNMDG